MRELLGRVKATVMGAVANADVPLEDAAEAAGLPPTAPLDAVHCVVHDEGFFKVEMEAEGRAARSPPPPPRGCGAPPPRGVLTTALGFTASPQSASAPTPCLQTRSRPPAILCAVSEHHDREPQAERLDVFPKETVMGESLLSLELSEVRGGLSGVIDYNKDVFRASTARRIAAHLEVGGPACGARPLTVQAQRCRQWGVCHVCYCATHVRSRPCLRSAHGGRQARRACQGSERLARGAQELLAAMAQGGPDLAVGALPVAREVARRLRSTASSHFSSLATLATSLASGDSSALASAAASRGVLGARARSSAGHPMRRVDTGALAQALRSAGASQLPGARPSARSPPAAGGQAAAFAPVGSPAAGMPAPGPGVQPRRSYGRPPSMRPGSAPGRRRTSTDEEMPSRRPGMAVGPIMEDEGADSCAQVLRAASARYGDRANAALLSSRGLPSPFASPFEEQGDSGEDGASVGSPASPVDADELLRRRTWGRMAGSASRPSGARGRGLPPRGS